MDESIVIFVLNNEIRLDGFCWNCKGAGKEPNEDSICSWCNGTGYQLTDVGQGIIDLIKRHIK